MKRAREELITKAYNIYEELCKDTKTNKQRRKFYKKYPYLGERMTLLEELASYCIKEKP